MHASFAIQRILAADAQCVKRGSHPQKDLLELELTCLRVILPIAESLVSQKAPMTCRYEICTRMSGWILTLRVSSQGIMSMDVEKHEAGAVQHLLWKKKFSFDNSCIRRCACAIGVLSYPCSHLGVVANDVAADLVESFLPQYGLGSLDGRGEDAIRSILAHRDAACSRARAAECWRDAGGGKGRSCAHESQETDGAANHTSNEETQTKKKFLLFRRVRGGGGRTDWTFDITIFGLSGKVEKSRAHCLKVSGPSL